MTLIVVNESPESDNVNIDGIIVYAEDKVGIDTGLRDYNSLTCN